MIDPGDHFRALIQSSEDAIVSKDLDGVVLSWNPAAERLFGYTAEEMIGQSIRRLLPDDRQQEEDAILAKIRAGDKTGLFYTKRMRKDGRAVDVAVTVSPVRDAAGAIVGASKIARDATALMESERRVRESELNFETLANNIAPFAWMANPDGHIFWYNRRWYDYTGTTLDEMAGWGWTKVHHPDHVDAVIERIQHSWDTGDLWEDTFPLRSKDGEYRWFLSRAQPIRDDNGQIVRWFGTNTDITESREQAEQIRLLLREVNHRAKNMLGTILAMARRSAQEGGENFLERFSDRLMSLSLNQDILVRRAWSEVPLDELISAQLDFATGAAGELEWDGPSVSMTPYAAEKLGMALHELATNALKYGALSVAGGKVAIKWRKLDGDGPAELLIEWCESGGPEACQPDRSGFGTTLIRDIPQRALGNVRLEFRPEGLFWQLHCNASALAGE